MSCSVDKHVHCFVFGEDVGQSDIPRHSPDFLLAQKVTRKMLAMDSVRKRRFLCSIQEMAYRRMRTEFLEVGLLALPDEVCISALVAMGRDG